MIFGPKIQIPPKAGREKLEACRASVQSLMNDLTDEAGRWAESRQRRVGEQPFLRVRRTNKKMFESRPILSSATNSIPHRDQKAA